jgi:hypothetical protein
VNSVGNLSYTFFSAKMPKRCTHVSDHRDFKISGKDSSPVRVFVTILVIKYIVLHDDILAGIFFFCSTIWIISWILLSRAWNFAKSFRFFSTEFQYLGL